MIQGFADVATRDIASGETSKVARKAVPQSLHPVAFRTLRLLDTVDGPELLRFPPGNELEALKKDRLGQHSIYINKQYRICFTWIDGNAEDVEIVDYH